METPNKEPSTNRHVLYIIMGGSGSGKTTLLQHVVYENKICKAAKKYSTRPTRPNIISNGITIQDDTNHLELEDIEKKCDVLYERNGNKYGASSSEIIEELNRDNYIIVISDIRSIKYLKKKVEESGHFVKVIYILSKMDSYDEFSKTCETRINSSYRNDEEKSPSKVKEKIVERLEDFSKKLKNVKGFGISETNQLCQDIKSYFPDSESNEKRYEKIKFTFKQYVYNIGLFDYVILNTTTLDDLYRQADNIINFNNNPSNMRVSKHQRIKGPVIFVVCASPKSGKGTLMENLNIMGANQIQITPKYSNRNPEPNDKRDGMCAIGKDDFEKLITNEIKNGNFRCWSFHGGTKYAIKRDDVISRLNQGIPQIFVSNFQALTKVLEKNGNGNNWRKISSRFVYIYLHRVRTDTQIKCQVDKSKIKDVKKTHEDYIKNISLIDHVLINPDNLTFSEDLHDQMMSLIELYKMN